MADLLRVDDPADDRLGDYAALNDPALRKRYEHRLGVFIAEGRNPVRELVASPYPVRSLLLAEERVPELGDLLDRVEAPAYVVPREVLYALVRFPLHQGVLGCGQRLAPHRVDQVVAGARRLLVLEGLGDHENLGTLFRSARALGADGVLLGAGCADPLYRRSVRVSMGHVLHLPFAWCGPVEEVVAELHAAGVVTVALTPDPTVADLAALPLPVERPVALLLGAEGPGLTAAARSAAHVRARIPMDAGVDSLNVAAAGAIALHTLRTAEAGANADRG